MAAGVNPEINTETQGARNPCLHSLADLVAVRPAHPDDWDYRYEGRCPRTGNFYSLPRTALAKAAAQGLMDALDADPQALGEGKMYGVLLVRVPGERGDRPHPQSLSPRERDFEEEAFRPPSPSRRGAGGEVNISVLKAFSGLWRGQAERPGWVPPIPGREEVVLQEAQTLDQLHRIKTRLQHLNALPERDTYARLMADFDQRRQALNQRHQQRREERAQQRQHLMATLDGEELATALAALDQASRGDKAEKRDFKRQQAEALDSLAAMIRAADTEIQALKRQRRALSQRLQADMHAVYRLTNFAGESLTLAEIQALEHSGLPTGTGDCCAPKLLHYAAQRGLQPLALAEFWWGPPLGDRQSGQFYGACEERCQPILGFLLAGLSAGSALSASTQNRLGGHDRTILRRAQSPRSPHPQPLSQGGEGSQSNPQSFSPNVEEKLGEEFRVRANPRAVQSICDLPILYVDDWLVVVDKPADLLSVPGRYGDRQDSVLSRLRLALPNGDNLRPVHRLDQATSGILVLARTADSHRHLSQQFAQRRLHKVYEALLEGVLSQPSGWINLPLSPDPDHPPRQRVDGQQGKPSQTYFEVLDQRDSITRVQLIPHTGRTHQLRVHAAHPQGLNAPIVGDRLYGRAQSSESPTHQRLHLHAKALTLTHPHHQMPLTFTTPVPF